MSDIVIENINKSYDGKPVIKKLSLVLREGQLYLLDSPSGTGKTTLLRILMGLENADSGYLRGVPRRISVMFQEDRLIEELSVRKNIELVADDKGRIEESLRELGLDGYADKAVNELSGGMKRRVALIRAILHASQLILLDEPFTGLDQKTKEEAAGYIIRHLDGRTAVIASHIGDEHIDAKAKHIDI